MTGQRGTLEAFLLAVVVMVVKGGNTAGGRRVRGGLGGDKDAYGETEERGGGWVGDLWSWLVWVQAKRSTTRGEWVESMSLLLEHDTFVKSVTRRVLRG